MLEYKWCAYTTWAWYTRLCSGCASVSCSICMQAWNLQACWCLPVCVFLGVSNLGSRTRQSNSVVLRDELCLYDAFQVGTSWAHKGVVWLTRHSSRVILILQWVMEYQDGVSSLSCGNIGARAAPFAWWPASAPTPSGSLLDRDVPVSMTGTVSRMLS
jgi:hypothetical protein